MQEITIGTNEAGQRLDKFLAKYMKLAPKSFFYKMMRKKNITLNGKKCEGGEMLAEGDTVKLFLADETIEKFSEIKVQKIQKEKKVQLSILYEDEDILLINKSAGMLSQKAKDTDLSLVEYLTDYLMENGSVTEGSLRSFKPSVCNRLDRNTSGIVAAGKSLAGSQMLSEVFRDRTVHKYYKCIVYGPVREARTVDGWLLKDPRTNQVKILSRADPEGEAKRIVTRYEPLAVTERLTLLKVTLLTGRSHQIRAHLSSMGHPILGDGKYGGGGTLELERKKEHFFAGFKVLSEPGYLKVADVNLAKKPGVEETFEDQKEENPDKNNTESPKVDRTELLQVLADLKKNDILTVADLRVKEGETSPPKRYTSGSMILAMENAGQLIEDEELRAQIKGSGIGTSATRAEILKKLVSIQYLSLNGKTQVITPSLLGEMVYDVVDHSIRQLLNPELTASWEKGLTYVAEGFITSGEYMEKLERFVAGRTVNVIRLNNQYDLRGLFDAAAVFYKQKRRTDQ